MWSSPFAYPRWRLSRYVFKLAEFDRVRTQNSSYKKGSALIIGFAFQQLGEPLRSVVAFGLKLAVAVFGDFYKAVVVVK